MRNDGKASGPPAEAGAAGALQRGAPGADKAKAGAGEPEGVSARVAGLIAKQLKKSVEEVQPDKDLARDLGADSLDIVEIVMTLEEHFDLRIPDKEAEKLKTAGQLINFIERHLKANRGR